MGVDVAWDQIQGKRDSQQDSVACLAWPSGLHLFIVADGIGGAPGGDIASKTVVQGFRSSFVESSELTIRDRLLTSLQAANYDLFDRISVEPTLNGMGTTVLAVCLLESSLWWVSVGDSPCWLVRHGEVRRLNEQHTVGALLDKQVEHGALSTEEAAAAPNRPHLTDAVLGDDIRWIDAPSQAFPLLVGDRLMMATDGIETCSDDELRNIASNHQSTSADIVEAVLRQVEAMARPDQDNASLVVASVGAIPVSSWEER